MSREETPAAIWVDPHRCGGEPCIYGHRLTTKTIAGHAWAASVDSASSLWNVTKAEVLSACWYEVRHGNRGSWRQRYPDWPREWNPQEWLDRGKVLAS